MTSRGKAGMFSFLSILFMVGLGATAHADEDDRSGGFPRGLLGLELHGGQSSFSGDLSSKSTAPTYGFDILLKTPRDHYGGAMVDGFAALWVLDYSLSSVTVKEATPFPFAPAKDVTISENAFVPTLCVMANLPVQSCLGLGWTQLDVLGDSNEQNYGTYRVDLRIGQFLREGLTGGLTAHYYDVQQTVNGKDSHFAALAYELALGWQW